MFNNRRTIRGKHSLLSLDALDADIPQGISGRSSSRYRSLLLRSAVLGRTRQRSDEVVVCTKVGLCVAAAAVGWLGSVSFFASQGNMGDGLSGGRARHVESSKTGSTDYERVVFSAQTAEKLKAQYEADHSNA